MSETKTQELIAWCDRMRFDSFFGHHWQQQFKLIGETLAAANEARESFDDVWMKLTIPGEFDAMYDELLSAAKSGSER